MTADQYPYARRLDLIEDLFGHEVRDPYRWLEDPDSEERVRGCGPRTTCSVRTGRSCRE